MAAIVGKRLLAGFEEWEIGSDTRTLSGGTADRARAITMHLTILQLLLNLGNKVFAVST